MWRAHEHSSPFSHTSWSSPSSSSFILSVGYASYFYIHFTSLLFALTLIFVNKYVDRTALTQMLRAPSSSTLRAYILEEELLRPCLHTFSPPFHTQAKLKWKEKKQRALNGKCRKNERKFVAAPIFSHFSLIFPFIFPLFNNKDNCVLEKKKNSCMNDYVMARSENGFGCLRFTSLSFLILSFTFAICVSHPLFSGVLPFILLTLTLLRSHTLSVQTHYIFALRLFRFVQSHSANVLNKRLFYV